MRWEASTKSAAEYLGWTVVETDGITDYQGWGVHLLKRDHDGVTQWGVLAWSYGSCSGCDPYEGILDGGWHYDDENPDPIPDRGSPRHCAEVFGENIEVLTDEESARQKFSERKGW